MKVGMILDAPFPPDLRVEKEALTLVSQGHEVILFCLSYDRDFYEEDYKGIKLAHYRSNKLEYKLSALAYTVPAYHRMMKRKLSDFITRYQPQVIHVHDMVIAGAALPLAKKLGITTVLDLHENRPEIMKEYLHLQKFPGRYLIDLHVWSRRQIALAQLADRAIVVTDQARKVLARDSGKSVEHIFVIPNTPSLDFVRHPLDNAVLARMEKTFNLLYVGDTSERRGTADMLEVVGLLKEEIPSIRLWVIGKSSFDSQLRELVAELQITDQVQFEGWQPENLFPSYITGSHICLSPLKRNLHHDTTFANKVFQYMSLGRPVLVSDCPAQAELIEGEKAGLVHKAGDLNDFAQKVLTLFRDRELREKAGLNAAAAVRERWHWEKTCIPLIDLYAAIKR
jgi:glycosyltransferase involved in cell wall biosynthesis